MKGKIKLPSLQFLALQILFLLQLSLNPIVQGVVL